LSIVSMHHRLPIPVEAPSELVQSWCCTSPYPEKVFAGGRKLCSVLIVSIGSKYL
jgi:hypothetical protein